MCPQKNDLSPPATACSIECAHEKDTGVEKGFDTDNEEVEMRPFGSGNLKLTSQMLGNTDSPLSSSGSSKELTVPDSADEADDECSEEDSSTEVEQHKKRKAKKEHLTNTQTERIIQPQKR